MCPDGYSGPRVPQKRVANFAQYTPETCPYRNGIEWELPEIEELEAIMEPSVVRS